MSDSIVIIPTYNEKENIEKIIRFVFGLKKEFDILIVEDNSPDGTADIVRRLMGEFPAGFSWRREKANWAWARHTFMDSSGHLPMAMAIFSKWMPISPITRKTLIKLYHACATDGADLAVGSRYVTGVNVVNWPMGRILMSYYASAYVRFITRIKVRDTTAGFVCYTRKVLEAINLDKIRFIGYAFQIEMKYTAWKLGFKIKEVPIIFTDRTEGQSKMSSGIFKEAIFGVMSLRLRNIRKIHRK